MGRFSNVQIGNGLFFKDILRQHGKGQTAMNVSVVIACLNEEENIGSCLDSLMTQRYARGTYEIIIIDGGSTDSTQDIAKKVNHTDISLRLVVELKKGTAVGRNAGIRAAQYDHIAFIDADCEAPPDWIETLVRHYQDAVRRDELIVAVGGTNRSPEDSSAFVQAVGVALDSYIGSFSSVQGRQFKNAVYVSSLATLNVLYDKQKIIDIGCFDESLGSEAEDAEMNHRLSTAGSRFMFIPDSFVWHKIRPTPGSWLKNMFRYGKGRARLLKRYPKMWAISYVLPILFMIFIASILLFPFSNIFFLSIFYFPALFCYSALHCLIKKKPLLLFHVTLVYLIQHFGYAAGEIYGLLSPKIK